MLKTQQITLKDKNFCLFTVVREMKFTGLFDNFVWLQCQGMWN